MKTLLRFFAAAACLTAIAHAAQSPAAATPPARGTERPDPAVVAQLRSGPPLPYHIDANWPQLPPGYNFGECSGVDVDATGNVWVFNRGHWPLIQLDRAGKMLRAISADTLHIMSSHGVRVGPDGNLWCVDVEGHVILKVSPEGRVLMVIGGRQGTPGNNDAQDGFNRPTNTAFRANGNIYVSDGYVNSRVAEFSPNGAYLRQWGQRGKEDGEFNLVHDVAVDPSGLVYVGDRNNERVQVFDADGKFLAKWTGLGSPWGLAFSKKDNALFMCDGKYDRILKLNLKGEVLGVLGSFGVAPGQLSYVHSIAIDQADGSLYTAEIKTWRVQKWVRDAR